MEIEFAPCYGDMALFLKLAKDYVEDLRKYDSSIMWDEGTWRGAVWNAWFIKEDRTVQGFVVTEEMDFKVYDKLLYIEEFYVVPEARRRGIGFMAADKLVDMWGGDIFFYVMEKNTEAKWFWTKVAFELGWESIERKEIREEYGCELMVYKTQ